MDDKTAGFVDELIAKQKALDNNDIAMADEIVEAQNPETLDEAKRFAAAWIRTAAQESRNAAYWQKRARASEKKLNGSDRPAPAGQSMRVSASVYDKEAANAAERLIIPDGYCGAVLLLFGAVDEPDDPNDPDDCADWDPPEVAIVGQMTKEQLADGVSKVLDVTLWGIDEEDPGEDEGPQPSAWVCADCGCVPDERDQKRIDDDLAKHPSPPPPVAWRCPRCAPDLELTASGLSWDVVEVGGSSA